jgi:hypothetical protein
MCFQSFPVPFPDLRGPQQRRFILFTEPLNNGQIYSLLPEGCDLEFPSNAIMQDMIQGNPLQSPCRQAKHLEREGYNTSDEIWTENFEKIKSLLGRAQGQELPSELSSFTLVTGVDPHEDRNTGRGAWGPGRLGPLLTEEFLDLASREFSRVNSGATTNGWH